MESYVLSLFSYERKSSFHWSPNNQAYGLESFVEGTLWTGTPGNYTNPDAPKALSEVRKLVDNGDYVAATEAAVKLSGNPSDV